MTDQAKLVPLPDDVRGWFREVMTGKAGDFAVLEDTAGTLDFTSGSV